MGDYTSIALDVLKKNKFRITTPRVQVLEFLDTIEVPVSAYDIVSLMKSKDQVIDTVTVYRILDCLESQNLVHRLMLDGKYVKCRIGVCDQHSHAKDHCHHLMVCQNCGKIAETHCPDVQIRQKDAEGFKVHGHRLEFYGLCKLCSKSTI